jgi:type II secretory pathway pseudopilin PulG
MEVSKRMQRRILQRGEGYTFIELLIAVTLLALITAPLLGLLATGFTAVHAAGQQTAAVNLCRAAMESLKSLGYAAVYDDYVLKGGSPREETALQGPFTRVTEVSTLPPDGGGVLQELELLQIRVTVFWAGKGAVRSATLESYLAPR